MPAGTCYHVVAENDDGTLQVFPLRWDRDLAVYSGYYVESKQQELMVDLRRGIAIKPEYLTLSEPR